MPNTGAVEVIQQGVPANRDRIAGRVRRGFHRLAETLEAGGLDTSLPRAAGNATHLLRPGPHRDWERWS
jgi:hypothetical protein